MGALPRLRAKAPDAGSGGAGFDRRRPASGADIELFQWWAARSDAPFETLLSGPSMGAAIPHGARIRIASLAGGRPLRGQIIAFQAGQRIMVHRVVHVGCSRRAQGYLITQGDGNWLCDPPIAAGSIAGAVEQYCVADVWRSVPPLRASLWRRLVAAPVLVLSRWLLERDPGFALRAARVLSRLRRLTRRIAARFGIGRADHVRH